MLKEVYNKLLRPKPTVNKIGSLPLADTSVHDQKERFNNILDFAKLIIKKSNYIQAQGSKYTEHPLINVIRLLGREIQAKYLIHLVSATEVSALQTITPDLLFFCCNTVISNDGKTFNDIIFEVKNNKEIYLSKDLILPSCWNRESLSWCFTNIGEGKPSGAFKQWHHTVKLWLPIGITWVSNGNHSIYTGIIQGEGIIKPQSTYDMSEVYDYVRCDGLNYIRIDNNSIITPVNNLEFAAIFEIGRLMKENSISF